MQAANTVIVHFSGNNSGEFDRAEVREVFGLVDNALRDLGEPAELTVPVQIKVFQALLDRAKSLLRGEKTPNRDSRAAEFLLYNFGGSLVDVVGRFLDGPRLTTFAEIAPKATLNAILLADRDDLIDIMSRYCTEKSISKAVVRCRAPKCLARRIEWSIDMDTMLTNAKTPDMYKPLIDYYPDAHLPMFGAKIVPEALRYLWNTKNAQECGKLCAPRTYLNAAIKLNDMKFANEVVSLYQTYPDAHNTSYITSARMLDLFRPFAGFPGMFKSLAKKRGVSYGPGVFEGLMRSFAECE